MKLQFYSIMFVAFFIWLLIWCSRQFPSTNVPTKHETKVLKFLIFCAWANLFNFWNKNNLPNYQTVTQHLKKYLKKYLLIQKESVSLHR
jgi:hypothetical protein